MAVDVYDPPRPLTSLAPKELGQPPFSTVVAGIDEIDATDPRELSSDRLRGGLYWMARQQRRLEAMQAKWLAEFDKRPATEPDGDATWWLQSRLHVTSNAAYAQVRTARQLERLAHVEAAFRAGQISSQHVSVICRAMGQVEHTCLEPGGAEQELVQEAKEKDPYSLQHHWQQMRYRADQEAGVVAEEEQRERRWLQLKQTPDDTWRIEGELDAENGVAVRTAMRALMGRGPGKGDTRTPAQRRCDALGELARRCLASGELPERGGQKPQVTLVANIETLRLEPGSPMATLDWGPLVTGKTARRIAEDCDVTPVLVNGKGDVLHVGRRTRTVPARLRRALNLRDGGCQEPGCDVPPELCTPHHKRHWADGGFTNLPNLGLRCNVHHFRKHPENERFRKGAAAQPSAP